MEQIMAVAASSKNEGLFMSTLARNQYEAHRVTLFASVASAIATFAQSCSLEVQMDKLDDVINDFLDDVVVFRLDLGVIDEENYAED
jgi:hypothetical protein